MRFNWKDKSKLTSIVLSAKSASDALFRMGLSPKGSNHKTFKKYISEYDIDISHFVPPHQRMVELSRENRLSNEKIFCLNSTYNPFHLKKRVLQETLIPFECCWCGNDGTWEGKELVLQLDHRNGIKTDCRLENLRFLCPNCHSQTETFAGKNSSNR